MRMFYGIESVYDTLGNGTFGFQGLFIINGDKRTLCWMRDIPITALLQEYSNLGYVGISLIIRRGNFQVKQKSESQALSLMR